ncbi:MAG: GAF domain-containing sensor histidine kinase [Acidimicrobiales bacterium]
MVIPGTASSSVSPFHRVEDPRRLQALIDAMLLIEADLDLPMVLRKIVESAVELAGARYGALGVVDESGTGLAEFVTVGVDGDTIAAIGSPPEGKGVLGLLVRDPHPIRLADISHHPDAAGFPPGHPPMRSFLGVPISAGGELYGNLYLCDKQGQAEFNQEDEDVIGTLGLAAGLVVDKARLVARLRELTLSEERERIARNLHDTVIQRLFAVGLSLQSSLRLVEQPEAQERISLAVEDLDETIRQIRTTIFAISRSKRRSGQGLRAQVLDLLDEAAGRLGLEVKVTLDGPMDTAVGEACAEHLLLALREAVSNVVRHAGASTIDVRIVVDPPSDLRMTVYDDGVGIDPAALGGPGRGLANLGERARLLGGACSVARRPGGGTELAWEIRRLS